MSSRYIQRQLSDKSAKKQKIFNASPPVFVKLPTTAHFVEGGNARFECQVRGDPMPEVIWRKNGKTIQNDHRHQIFYNPQTGESFLAISNLTLNDDGEYNCTALNSAGEASLTVSMEKQMQQPQPYQTPQDRRLQDLTNVSGQPQYAIQQSTSLTKIRREKSVSETPVYYSGSDQTFRVEIFESRLLREVEFRETLIRRFEEYVRVDKSERVIQGRPLSAPQVLQKPRNSKILEGSNVTFQAKISGNPVPQVYWFKDGQPLIPSERVKITFQDNFVTLHIHMASPDDAGYYTLLLESRSGRIASSCHLVIESLSSDQKVSTSFQTYQIETTDMENRDANMLQASYANGVQEAGLKPQFTRVPTDIQVPEGKMVRFDCSVRGRPPPEVTWFLGNRQVANDATHKILVNEGGVHSLMITYVNRIDAGCYTCIARNKNGEDRFAVNLAVIEKEVLEAPRFVERFTTVHIREGDQLVLHCKTVAIPTATLTWQKDGNQIYANPRIAIQSNDGASTLCINQATPQDSGWYQCNAANKAGTASNRGRINVEPAMKQQATERHYLNIQKTNKVIEPVTSPPPETVLLKHIERPAPAKRRDSDTEYLSTRPAFTTHLRDVMATEGERVHFEARLIPIGDPNLKVQWLHNGRPLQASSRVMTTFNFGYVSLTLLGVESKDEGVYVCHAFNDVGEATSTANLKVRTRPEIERTSQHPESLDNLRFLEEQNRYQRPQIEEDVPGVPPTFIKPLSSLDDLIENGFAHFEAQITPVSDPTMRIEWYFNGRPLSAGSRISTVYSFGYIALNIAYLRLEDSGVYLCRAVNSRGEAKSSATLKVRSAGGLVTSESGIEEQQQFIRKTQELEEYHKKQYASAVTEDSVPDFPPKFLKKLKDQLNIHERGTAHFEATLEPQGDPSMRVDWYKDGQPLEASSRINTFFNFGYVALTIEKLEMRDAGIYTVVATNRQGRDDTSARLTVISKQTIITDVQYEDGWEKIQHLEDSSKYRRTEEEDIEVRQKPRFTCPLSGPDSVVEGKSGHFETRLEPISDPNMKVEWYFNGKSLTTGHRFKTYFDFGYVALDVLYLFPEDTGVFAVKATNKFGEAMQSKQIAVQGRSSIDTSTLHEEGLQQIKYLERDHHEPAYIADDYSRIKPYFVLPLKNPGKVFDESESVHLEARIEPINDPSLTVSWFFNGKPLRTGHRFKTRFDFGYISLDVSDLFQSDSGEYTVRVANQLGSAESSAIIKVSGKEKVITDAQYPEGLDQIRLLEDQNRYKKAEIVDDFQSKPPVFTKTLKNIETIEGTNIHLEARLLPSGDPSMVVEWYRNGQPIPVGHRFRPLYDFEFVALDLLQVYAEDSGVYTCKAKNNMGEATTSSNVTIFSRGPNVVKDAQNPEALQQIQHLEDHSQYRRPEEMDEYMPKKPRFLTQFNDVTLHENKTAHFECRIEPTNDPRLRVEWFRNGVEMMAGNRYQPFHDFGFVALNILKCVDEDNGQYTCRLTNDLGSAEQSVNLKVTSRATIERQSTNPESYKRIQQLEDTSRYIREVEDDDLPKATPVFTRAPKNVEIHERDKARFECNLTPVGDPNLRIEWYKDDRPLIQGSRFLHIFDFGYVSLEIMDAVPEDSGRYTCKAVNDYGQAVTAATLLVHGKKSLIMDPQLPESYEAIQKLESYTRARPEPEEAVTSQPPVFTSAMRNLELQENELAHFECRLIPVGDPTLKVEWFYNGLPLLQGSRVKSVHDFGYVGLDISKVMPQDSGTYTCKATNLLGQAACSATLKVFPSSNILRESQFPDGLQKIAQLESQNKYVREHIEDKITTQSATFVTPLKGPTELTEGMHGHYECRIEPFPDSTMKVEWFKNGKQIQLGHRFRTMNDFGFAALDILSVMPEDSGEYTIRATNHLGSTTSSINLRVHGKASVILDPQQPDSLPKIKALEDQTRFRREEIKEKEILEKPNFGKPLYNLDDLKEGQAAHLETTLTPVNDPTMRVEWFVNGQAISTGSRFKTMNDFGYVALDVANVMPEDSGLYMCRATNKNGEAVVTCSVKVLGSSNVETNTLHEQSLAQIQRLETQYIKPVEAPQAPKQKPVFTVPLKSAENVKEGQSVHLECRLEPINDPKLVVEWYHNGITLRSGHRFRTTYDFGYVALDILYAYPEDSGTYICRAYNELGEAVTTAAISVQGLKNIYGDTYHPEGLEKIQQLEAQPGYIRPEIADRPVSAPVFVSQLQGITQYGEGQSAHFEGRVEPAHDPNLGIEIFHNNKPLVSGSRYHVTFDFGYIALDITKLVPEDSGTYTVRVFNQLGEAFSSISIQVGGISAIQSDSLHSSALPKIKELENPYIPEKIQEVPTFQTPFFTQPLENLDELSEGQNAHLECRLIPVGDPNLKVEWFLNSQPLIAGSRFRTVHDFGYVALDIMYLMPEDAGVYMCKATNQLGEGITSCSLKIKTKSSIVLDTQHPEGLQKIKQLEQANRKVEAYIPEKVFDRPVFITPLNGPETVIEEQSAHFECRVEPVGDPNMTIHWFLNGIELKAGSRFKVVYDFGYVALDIAKVTAEDAGVYMCKAVNKQGEAVVSTTMKVTTKSSILSESLHPETHRKTQRMEMEASRIPEQIESKPSRPPVFTKQLNSHESLTEGQSVHIGGSVEPIDDEKLQINWYKNGRPLVEANRIITRFDFGLVSLDIVGVRPDDSGIYTCRAVNELGEAVSTCTIKVEGKSSLVFDSEHPESLEKIRALEAYQNIKPEIAEPEFSAPVFITMLNNNELREGEKAHYECRVEPSKDATLKIEVFHNNRPLQTGSRFAVTNDFGFITLDIFCCYPEDSGIYTVKASNSKGQAVTSGSLKVHPKSSIILSPQHPMGDEAVQKIQELEARAGYIRPVAPETVYPKPSFVVPLQTNFSVKESESLHLECKVEPSGDPNLTIEWFVNGVQIEMGSRFVMMNDFGFVVLDIKDVQTRDNGIWTAKASNLQGEAFSSTTIIVAGSDQRVLEATLHPEGQRGLQQIQQLEESLNRKEAVIQSEENRPPVFTSQFKALSNMVEGDSVHFEATLQPIGDDNMKIEWFHNGKQLKSGHRIRTYYSFGLVLIEIIDLRHEDAGEYVCVASNKVGRTSQSVTLEVVDREKGDKPKFTSQLQSMTGLKTGESAHFECFLTPVGDPHMFVKWYHNKKELRESSRIKTISDFGFVVLDISFLHEDDSGEYVCVATNKYGSDVTRCTIEVTDMEVNVVRETIQANSMQKIAQLEGLTKYQKSSAQAKSTINQAPKFITQIESIDAIIEGQSAHFEAQLTPTIDPYLKVEWYLNGKLVPLGHRIRTFHDFGIVILDILDAISEDSGEYICKATNRLGSDITRAYLNVKAKSSIIYEPQIPPEMASNQRIIEIEEMRSRKKAMIEQVITPEAPIFTKHLENPAPLREGENIHLEAKLTPTNDSQLRVDWFHNGRPLKAGTRIRTIHDFGFVVLEISPVYPEDSGVYTCRARNKHGEAITTCTIKIEGKRSVILESQLPQEMSGGIEKIAQIEENASNRIAPIIADPEIAQAPQFITEPSDQSLSENAMAHFECRVTPAIDPNMKVEWFFNGRPLVTGSRVRTINDFGFVILEIAGVYARDSGVYTCEATNKHGKASVSCKLTVKSKQSIVMEPQLPQGFITGYENIQRLEESLWRTPEVIYDQEKRQPPKFLAHAKDCLDKNEGESAHFEGRLEPVGDPNLKLEWFHNGVPIQTGSRIKTVNDFGFVVLVIDWLFARDSGEYVCKATNKYGVDYTKAVLRVKSKKSVVLEPQLPADFSVDKLRELDMPKGREVFEEETKIQAPKFVTQIQSIENLIEGDSAHFECKLLPITDPNLKVEWFFNGKPLLSGHRFKTTHDFGVVALDILYVYQEDSGEYIARARNKIGEDVTRAVIRCRAKQKIVYNPQLPKEMETGVQKIAELEASRQRVDSADVPMQERQPPMFVMKPEPLTVLEGEWAKFCCRVVGFPRPKVFWVINGNTVVNGTRYKLSYDGIYHLDIPRARQYDKGKIEVFARNILGEAYCFTTLDVRPRHDDYRAVLKNSPRPWYDQQMAKYQRDRQDTELEKVFEEKLTPGGTESEVWRTAELGEDERVKIREHKAVPEAKKYATDTKYVDKKSLEQKDDNQSNVSYLAKSYQSHVQGQTKEPQESKVHDKSVLTKKAQQTQKELKGDLEITRKINTTETLAKEHSGVTKERRVIGPPVKAKPPIFTKKLEPVRVFEGERATLECFFEGDPTPVVTWFRENFEIQNSRDFQIESKANKSTLTIREVYLEDSGVFSVKVENAGGSAKSSTNLVVEERKDFKSGASPPSFSKTIDNLTVKSGELARFDARIVGSKPFDVYWLKNGTKVMPDVTHKMIEDDDLNTFIILEALPEDAGKYECVAVNQVGEARCQATFKVEGPRPQTAPSTGRPGSKEKKPKLVEPLKDLTVNEGGSALFKCKIQGVSPSQITWYKGDSIIKQSRYFRMGNERDVYTLRISEAFPEDEGLYKCIAANSQGSVTTKANLKVSASDQPGSGSPPTLSPLQSLVVPLGSPARFVTSVGGSPAPLIAWFKNGNQIQPGRDIQIFQDNVSSSLTIQRTTANDAGRYLCRAGNDFGQSETSAELKVRR